ncbi:MAG: NnrS family protein [Gammaproteobacteria bacterium]|nr:NnrS family protein [Gammaproteobacteria bacterium]
MAVIQINQDKPIPEKTFSLFALGFRPFFLFAALSAVLLMLNWVMGFVNGWSISSQYPAYSWHSHEMVFGYTVAVIAGFLLTSVRNWTGIDTPSGKPLLALLLLWLAGRILPLTSVDMIWLSMVDIAFLPVLAIAIAIPIIRVRQWHNLFFVPILILLALANATFHAGIMNLLFEGDKFGLFGGLALLVVLIVIMAGRVIGFFIDRGLDLNRKEIKGLNELLVIATTISMVGQFVIPTNILFYIVTLTAVLHVIRMIKWHHPGIWRVPLLWVLFLGYGWLTVGFILNAIEVWGMVNPAIPAVDVLRHQSLVIHAFTAGAIGVITLGMMSRVTLGHTGRAMQSHTVMTGAFVLINLAVVVRVFFPMFEPAMTLNWIELSGGLWALAFFLFLLIQGPMLLKARVDGRPG